MQCLVNVVFKDNLLISRNKRWKSSMYYVISREADSELILALFKEKSKQSLSVIILIKSQTKKKDNDKLLARKPRSAYFLIILNNFILQMI